MPAPWRETYLAFPRSVRDRIIRRANGRCEIRGPQCVGVASVADHVIPDSQGGTNDISNGQAACDPCHDAKSRAERVAGMRKRSRYRQPMPHPGLLA